jgi:hypothetical protein
MQLFVDIENGSICYCPPRSSIHRSSPEFSLYCSESIPSSFCSLIPSLAKSLSINSSPPCVFLCSVAKLSFCDQGVAIYIWQSMLAGAGMASSCVYILEDQEMVNKLAMPS